MCQRFVAVWFPHLVTDFMLRHQPQLNNCPFALALHEKNKRVVKAVNHIAQAKGALTGMVVADCKAIVPDLQVFDYDPEQPKKLLWAMAQWCIRYTPVVSLNVPDGLMFDASGCTHLWGGELPYLQDIEQRFKNFGYTIKTAMADTIGAAWAQCRFANSPLVKSGNQAIAMASLPANALRLDVTITEKLEKLGLSNIGSFMNMPRPALRRRFGQSLLTQLDRALGYELEILEPINPPAPYQERLPCLEPISTAPGIEIALRNLLDTLCERLNRECKGLRKCELRSYRLDGNIQNISIGTNRPSRNTAHLFKLFENRISEIEPGLGIELFVLEASEVEELQSAQDALWSLSNASETAVAELLDRLAGKTGAENIYRFLPDEHYWPERSVRTAASLKEEPATQWRSGLPRPLHLLSSPEPIEVTVPIPDYPPLLFKYKHRLHTVKKADGPERIEQEWWLQSGVYRDYYCVEDEQGMRYWLFRSGSYESDNVRWFMHGFFA